MKTFLVILVGLIGIIAGAILLSIGDENTTFQTRFILKLVGLLLFIGAVFFVQRYWSSLK
ncbi:hypothetical protein [Cytobacillus gottheilii]|uniref:Uncharacterized protein n=1 Tax=Cytobacillus gottheilii TaxID=859144 RepID=A0ABX8FJ02_9BACI|nr:hypothetical protein [Cytobacillus gottheilii]QVY63988.1 hypothetical protein J1899_22380 [Cytobacillus gottheilii]